MLMIPSKYDGPRRHKTRATPTTPPPTGPLEALSATVVAGTSVVQVTVLFNTTPAYPLAGVAGASVGNWALGFGGSAYACGLIQQSAYNAIQLSMVLLGPAEDGYLSYAADPSDISDTAGRMLAAFWMEM